MENNYEIIKKSEVVLEDKNLEVTDRVKTIKNFMDAVISSSIIETTDDVLYFFNRILNCNSLQGFLSEMYPLFEFEVEKSIIIAWTEKTDNCRSVPSFVTNLTLYSCKNLKSLEGLSEGLESLEINECDNLISLKGLPKGLKSLEVEYCEGLRNLEGLPEGLENLEIDEYSRRNLDEESLKMLEKFGV